MKIMGDKRKISPSVKSSSAYLFATIIGQGMSFAGIIIFTRLMDQRDYGDYSTYYACVSMLTVLIGANLYYALNNAYIERKGEIREFRKSVLALSTLIMLAVMMALLLAGAVISKRFSTLEIIVASVHSYSFFVVTYRIFSANMENDYKRKQWLLVLPNMLQLLFALGFILALPWMPYKARMIGSASGVALVAVPVYVDIMRCEGRVIKIEHWKYALSITMPTIVMSLSFMIMQQCDKLMINKICGAEETAVYSVVYYIGYAIMAVDQAAAPVRQAWIFRKIDGKDLSKAVLVQKWYLFAMGILAAGIIMAGPEITKLLAPDNYWRFEYIVPFVLSGCMMLLYRFFTEIILFYKRNITLSLYVLLCALVNIGLNVLLIPRAGAVAACYTTVAAYSILFALTWRLAGKYGGRIYSWKVFMAFLGWIVFVALSFSVLCNNEILRYAWLFVFLSSALLYAWHAKSEWRKMVWEEAK